MEASEEEVAREIEKALYAAIQDETNYSARSLQSKDFRVGISDLGFCHERTRRMIDQQVPEDTDMLPAWIGTHLGDGMEAAAKRAWPAMLLQSTVTLELVGPDSGRTYTIEGHPDMIEPEKGWLLDGKTSYGLTNVERTGPSKQQEFQRNLYALAAYQEGLFADSVELEDILVGNVWMDRAGIERRLHADVKPFNPDFVAEAAQWIDDVVYAYLQGEEAEKDPPREMCAKACGFYRVCRQHDTDVEGLITDQVAVTAASMYREGQELEKKGRQLKKEAQVHLYGIQGSTGDLMIRWTHVNGADVAYQRAPYDKLEVKEIKK